MINKVSIRNFKCLRDVQIDLERFTVFVGANASGKTSVLQALDLLCRSWHCPCAALDEELSRAQSRGSTDRPELAGLSGGVWHRYRSLHASQAQTLDTQANAGQAAAGLPHSVLLRLERSKLVDPTPACKPTVMAPDGSGLHSALAHLAVNNPESWRRLQEELRQIIPLVGGVRHTQAQPPALLFDVVGADSVPADQVSEGVLMVLGMLAALHAPGRPNLVLLDDLDRGLHPVAQKDLIALLCGLLDANPDLQIVATTYSPYLLNWVEPGDVRMTYLVNGATVCGPLSKHPQFQRWNAEFSPGELWTMFGEKWLAALGGSA